MQSVYFLLKFTVLLGYLLVDTVFFAAAADCFVAKLQRGVVIILLEICGMRRAQGLGDCERRTGIQALSAPNGMTELDG